MAHIYNGIFQPEIRIAVKSFTGKWTQLEIIRLSGLLSQLEKDKLLHVFIHLWFLDFIQLY